MTEFPEINNDIVPTLVRLPAETHRAIKEMADREHRSVNKQIVHMIERMMDHLARAT